MSEPFEKASVYLFFFLVGVWARDVTADGESVKCFAGCADTQ